MEEILYEEKYKTQEIFDKLVDDELELCTEKIHESIKNGQNNTNYIVKLNKRQSNKIWKPKLACYQNKSKINKKYMEKIELEMEKEDLKTQKMIRQYNQKKLNK